MGLTCLLTHLLDATGTAVAVTSSLIVQNILALLAVRRHLGFWVFNILHATSAKTVNDLVGSHLK